MKLAFYDHARQRYAGAVPIDNAAEFMVGDYQSDDGGVGEGGEFQIVLHRFSNQADLSPQVRVFHDAIGSFMQAVGMGLLAPEVIGPVKTADEFSWRLLALGMADHSDKKLVE